MRKILLMISFTACVILASCTSHKASELECYMLQDSINNNIEFEQTRLSSIFSSDYYPDSIKYNLAIMNINRELNNFYGSSSDTISMWKDGDSPICVLVEDYINLQKKELALNNFCIQNNKPFSFAQQEDKKLWDDFFEDASKKQDEVRKRFQN